MSKGYEELDDLLDGDATYEKMWNDALETVDVAGLDADALNNLVHTLTARRLVEALRDPVRCTPGFLQCALRFMKDNDITALPIPGSAHAILKEKLGDSLPFKPRLAAG